MKPIPLLNTDVSLRRINTTRPKGGLYTNESYSIIPWSVEYMPDNNCIQKYFLFWEGGLRIFWRKISHSILISFMISHCAVVLAIEMK
jgi:hypothetical protein